LCFGEQICEIVNAEFAFVGYHLWHSSLPLERIFAMETSATFSFQHTVDSVMKALGAIFCHVVFDAGLHGLFMALIVGAIGYACHLRGAKQGKPLMNVCRKLSLFCLALMIPGFISLLTTHALPPVGVYNVHSIGFICFWSLICLHISAEEMNYQFFPVNRDRNDPDLQGN